MCIVKTEIHFIKSLMDCMYNHLLRGMHVYHQVTCNVMVLRNKTFPIIRIILCMIETLDDYLHKSECQLKHEIIC